MRFERVIVALATLAAVAGTARLGVWQLDRAAGKQALQHAIEQRQAMPPLPAQALASDPAAAAAQTHRSIQVRGRWLPEATVFLENRQWAGRPGFLVLTPLELADGSAVVVQRGWLPRDAGDRTRVDAPALPSGEVAVTARIAPPPSRLLEFDGAGQGAIRQNLDLDAYAGELRRTLRPLSLLQLDGSTVSADGLVRDWPRPASGVHKHYGYAFQWFALSALLVGLYVWFQLIRPRRRA